MFGWSISASACRSASNRAIDLLGVHAQLDDLERHPAAHRLLLLGHIDHAATAFADLLQQLVAANAVAGLFRQGSGKAHGSGDAQAGWRRFQEPLGGGVCAEQVLDLLTQGGVPAHGFVQIGRSLRRAEFQGRVQHGHFPIWLLGHRVSKIYHVMRKAAAKRTKNRRAAHLGKEG